MPNNCSELALLVSVPVVLISGVKGEAGHFMSVFSQLFVAGHAVSVNNVDHGVLGANPHLLLDQSQHAVLHRTRDGSITNIVVHTQYL